MDVGLKRREGAAKDVYNCFFECFDQGERHRKCCSVMISGIDGMNIMYALFMN